ncbi:MAG: o-succinylbenzoate--CoA ligase [Rubrobacter sp.]
MSERSQRRPPESIVCPVRAAALKNPESVAISSPGGRITFRELDREVSALARRIRGAGLRGGRVGMYLEKSAGQTALILALVRSGSVAVPVSTRTPPAEVPEMLLRAGCRTLVTDDPQVKEAATDSDFDLLGLAELSEETSGETAEDEPLIVLDSPATIVFTSGSTGLPKAALHTFHNHHASAVGSARNIPLVQGDVWLHSLPLFHVGGLSILFRCALSGATVALSGAGETVGESIRRSGATHVSLVATQLGRLLSEGVDLSGVRAILLGGSAIPESLLDRAHALELPVYTSYGLTEMASQVTTTRPGASRSELHTSGRTLAHRELRVSGRGEILVRGATLFSGYVAGDGLDRPLDADGWFHTKDLGSLDTDGLLTVTRRLDNLFVSGGENIQPEEVEVTLRRLHGVDEAVVVPVADREFGERPVAFVKSEGELPDDLALRSKEKLPAFKVPVAFYEWPDDAPQTMKIDRTFFERKAKLDD